MQDRKYIQKYNARKHIHAHDHKHNSAKVLQQNQLSFNTKGNISGLFFVQDNDPWMCNAYFTHFKGFMFKERQREEQRERE